MIGNRNLSHRFFGHLLLGIVLFSVSTDASAQTSCQTAFRKYFAKYLANNSDHFAVSTTGGRPLSAAATSCGISGGQKTRKLSMKESLQTCGIEKLATGNVGTCKIIKSR